ncbi:MAG: hypothetical protein ACHBNF_21735 [Chromatiales bacterium]
MLGTLGRKPVLWAFRRVRSLLLPAVPSITPFLHPDRKGGIGRADAPRPLRCTDRFGRQHTAERQKSGFRPVRLTGVVPTADVGHPAPFDGYLCPLCRKGRLRITAHLAPKRFDGG